MNPAIVTVFRAISTLRNQQGVARYGSRMNGSTFKIRLMKSDVFCAVVGIDEKGLESSSSGYYEVKFEKRSEFMNHLKRVGVQKVCTLVDWNDSGLIRFFSANQFSPSKTINLERSL